MNFKNMCLLFSDAISGAAVAIVKALSDSKKEGNETPQSSSGALGAGVSPRKAVDLRVKNCQQLRYLQQLYEDNISDEKYLEQKNSILAALRNITS